MKYTELRRQNEFDLNDWIWYDLTLKTVRGAFRPTILPIKKSARELRAERHLWQCVVSIAPTTSSDFEKINSLYIFVLHT